MHFYSKSALFGVYKPHRDILGNLSDLKIAS